MKTTGEHAGQASELLTAAVRYAEERHWDVVPGTWMEDDSGVPRCSCGDAGCAAPGAHPGRDWPGASGASGTAVRRMWAGRPRAAVVLPTGRSFDVVDVPESAGCLALVRLERGGTEPGPVAAAPDGRMYFFVLPGAAAKTPVLLRKLGYAPASLDLVVRGEGAWTAAPPTRFGVGGAVRWVRSPGGAHAWLPEMEGVLGALAYACACGRR